MATATATAPSSAERNKIFDTAKAHEADFITALRELLETVVNPINVRDTPFKRTFLNDPVVALSLSLLFEIHKACSNFYFALNYSKSDADIAKAYGDFAPSLQLFAQYTAENSKFLNTVERNRKNIAQCMSKEIDYIPVLIEPLNHYPKYRMHFQELVRNCVGSKDSDILDATLNVLVHESEYVDIKLQEEKESLKLLALQSMCESFCPDLISDLLSELWIVCKTTFMSYAASFGDAIVVVLAVI
jgi:hypothetical protein